MALLTPKSIEPGLMRHTGAVANSTLASWKQFLPTKSLPSHAPI
jgi:hypothetical protein